MTKLYQEELSGSVKTLLNSFAQVESYISMLGKAKVKCIAKNIIGKEFSLYTLCSDNKTYDGIYEDVFYKAVLVESSFCNYNLIDSIRRNDCVSHIHILFMRDPEVILNSKLKLTDQERKILKELKNFYCVKEGYNPTYYSKHDVENLCGKLSPLKHHILVSISLSWSYTIEDLLQDNFMTKGIKAQRTLI